MRFALIGFTVLVVAAGIGATTLAVVPQSDSEPLRPIQVTAPATPQPSPQPMSVSPSSAPFKAPAPKVAPDSGGVPPPPPPAHTKIPTVSPPAPSVGNSRPAPVIGGDWDDDSGSDDGDDGDDDGDDGDDD